MSSGLATCATAGVMCALFIDGLHNLASAVLRPSRNRPIENQVYQPHLWIWRNVGAQIGLVVKTLKESSEVCNIAASCKQSAVTMNGTLSFGGPSIIWHRLRLDGDSQELTTSAIDLRSILLPLCLLSLLLLFPLSISASRIEAPIAGHRGLFEPAWLLRLRFLFGAKEIIRKGYTKVNFRWIDASFARLNCYQSSTRTLYSMSDVWILTWLSYRRSISMS
jgi:uncharacterized membrane protein YbhN (UPF0104 family)